MPLEDYVTICMIALHENKKFDKLMDYVTSSPSSSKTFILHDEGKTDDVDRYYYCELYIFQVNIAFFVQSSVHIIFHVGKNIYRHLTKLSDNNCNSVSALCFATMYTFHCSYDASQCLLANHFQLPEGLSLVNSDHFKCIYIRICKHVGKLVLHIL